MTATIHCKNCNYKIANSNELAFYQQTEKSYHLIIKLEKRNKLLSNIKLTETQKLKEKKFKPYEVYCKNDSLCQNKLGCDMLIGPKAESIICFKSESFYFLGK
jgi:hypothetical protein